jgi:hypothetical protein
LLNIIFTEDSGSTNSLSQAEIHMVENKEESLARARERGVQLGLNNVWFYQSNMDYYQVLAGAQQCLIFSVQHGLLSGESSGHRVSFYQSNMDYYQVKAGAQQCLILPVQH